jgi:hypothetical protein
MAEDNQLYADEHHRLCGEHKNLFKKLCTLEEDLKELEQGDSIME